MSLVFTYEGIDLVASLITGNSQNAVDTVYVEYYNSGGNDTHSDDRTEGRSYYDAMESSNAYNQDYLRIPVFSSKLESTNTATFKGNLVNFIAVVLDGVGEGGTTFSEAEGSTVFGAALVSRGDTKEKDKVLARFYFNPKSKAADNLTVQIKLNLIDILTSIEDT